jgi:glycerol kinase
MSEPGQGLLLALDQGGHASRALLFDETGREVAAAHVPVATRHEHSLVEHDPDELARSLRLAIADVCEHAPDARFITAAGLATQRSTIVCWERATAHPLSAAISWQDRRGWRQVEELRPVEREVRALSGLVLSPHYGASKLRWCLDQLPAVRRAAADGSLACGPLSSFLMAKLLDEHPALADPANASRTQLYDPSRGDWADPLLTAFGLPRSCLPTCVPTLHAFGTLRSGDDAWPLRACTGDQSAAVFAAGAPRADTAYVNVGTGAFVQCLAADTATVPDGLLRSVLFADGRQTLYTLEGTVNGAGSAVDWLRERTGIDAERAIASLPGPAAVEPPIFLNGVGGLGAPYWRHDFESAFVGEGDELARLCAVVESIAFLLCVNLERMRTAADLRRIAISGGLARSDHLCSVLAAGSGLVVARMRQCEATARGAAFLAAGCPENWQPVEVEKEFLPAENPALHARFHRWRKAMEQRLG